MSEVFYDFEFLEDGTSILPISLGMIRNDGEAYYAVFSDAPWERVKNHVWLCENVIPHLPLKEPLRKRQPILGNPDAPTGYDFQIDTRSAQVRPGWVIANEVREFTSAGLTGRFDRLELWADYGAYDHVCLMQMYGSMMDKPQHFPMFTHDVQQEMDRLGVVEEDIRPQAAGSEHQALSDCEQVRRKWQACVKQREIEEIILNKALGGTGKGGNQG